MAGRRRTTGRRGADGQVRPIVPTARVANIRGAARERYGEAQNALERLTVAVDYLRSAAVAADRAGMGETDVALVEVTRRAMQAGDALTDALLGAGSLR